MGNELVINYLLSDDLWDKDKSFSSLEDLKTYLDGQRESDFVWIDLYDSNNDGFVCTGWSEIHQYIRENTGAHLEPKPVC